MRQYIVIVQNPSFLKKRGGSRHRLRRYIVSFKNRDLLEDKDGKTVFDTEKRTKESVFPHKRWEGGYQNENGKRSSGHSPSKRRGQSYRTLKRRVFSSQTT